MITITGSVTITATAEEEYTVHLDNAISSEDTFNVVSDADIKTISFDINSTSE